MYCALSNFYFRVLLRVHKSVYVTYSHSLFNLICYFSFSTIFINHLLINVKRLGSVGNNLNCILNIIICIYLWKHCKKFLKTLKVIFFNNKHTTLINIDSMNFNLSLPHLLLIKRKNKILRIVHL